MSIYTESEFESSAFPRRSPVVRSAAQQLLALGARLRAWFKAWRAADATRQQLAMMNDRELLDIGMTRVDIDRASWGASPRDERCPPN